MKKHFLKSICMFLLLLFLFPMPAVHASSDGINPSSEFSGNITKKDNYYLDLEECKILDSGYKIINDLANVLFSVIKTIAYITCEIFSFAINFNLTDLFGERITDIQEFLKREVFDVMFLVCFVGTAIMSLKHFLRRDMVGVFTEIGKAIVIAILAMALSLKGGTILDSLNTLTKQTSLLILQAMGSIEGTDTKEYASNTGEVLWDTLVHVPWESLEFGSTGNGVDSSLEDRLLNEKPSSEKRAQIVEANKSYFEKEKASERLGALISYFFPFIAKCVIYIAIVVIQIVFQGLGILLMMIGMLVLMLAMLPGYEMDFVWIWIKKLIENQMDILIMTFIMGFIISVDNLLYSMSSGTSLGWLGISMLQVAVMGGLILCRKQVFGGLKKVQKAVRNPAPVKTWLRHSETSMEYSQRVGNRLGEWGMAGHRQLEKGVDRSVDYVDDKIDTLKKWKAKRAANYTGHSATDIEKVDCEVVYDEEKGRTVNKSRIQKSQAPRLYLGNREQKASQPTANVTQAPATRRLIQKNNVIENKTSSVHQKVETSGRRLTPNNVKSAMHNNINANGAKAEAGIEKRGLNLSLSSSGVKAEDIKLNQISDKTQENIKLKQIGAKTEENIKLNKMNTKTVTEPGRKIETPKKYADGIELKNFSQNTGSVSQIAVPAKTNKEKVTDRPRLTKPRSEGGRINRERLSPTAEVASRRAAGRR